MALIMKHLINRRSNTERRQNALRRSRPQTLN
jgi:hypothetical protein